MTALSKDHVQSRKEHGRTPRIAISLETITPRLEAIARLRLEAIRLEAIAIWTEHGRTPMEHAVCYAPALLVQCYTHLIPASPSGRDCKTCASQRCASTGPVQVFQRSSEI